MRGASQRTQINFQSPFQSRLRTDLDHAGAMAIGKIAKCRIGAGTGDDRGAHIAKQAQGQQNQAVGAAVENHLIIVKLIQFRCDMAQGVGIGVGVEARQIASLWTKQLQQCRILQRQTFVGTNTHCQWMA